MKTATPSMKWNATINAIMSFVLLTEYSSVDIVLP